MEIGMQELYSDLEVNNFLDLIDNDQLIENNFGETIKVCLNVNKKTGQMQREVKEYQHLAKGHSQKVEVD